MSGIALPSSKEMMTDNMAGGLGKPYWDEGFSAVLAVCLTFTLGITIALVLHICIGPPQVYHSGVVVTDSKICTLLGRKVLEDQGSSIDSAIAAVLCSGIVHPHRSGLGGGGMILVHDVQKNQSRIVDFRETAPSALTAEMLQQDLHLKPGLLVAVPGMLSGLHQAHELYGRLQWKNVVSRAAAVAREGFRVSHSLSEALSTVRDQYVSEHFRNVLLPDGQAVLPGIVLRQHALATLLDRVAEYGVSEFYHGHISQDIASEIQARGGVLTEQDLNNYTAIIRQPLESIYQGQLLLTSPPPYGGAALISALNVVEALNLTARDQRKNTYHWIVESLRAALGMGSGLGDPRYDSAVSDSVLAFSSKSQAAALSKMISDSQAYPAKHYKHFSSLKSGADASQVIVMGQDDLIVSAVSTLNRPFGSKILTSCGVLLNSQILDFSWPDKTKDMNHFNSRNQIQPGKRPMSFLTPTVVRPLWGKCGTYVALSSSNGDYSISGITQVLVNVLSFHKNLSDSVASGRLHPQPKTKTLLVDTEFLERDEKALQLKNHRVQRVAALSVVHGAERINDIVRGITDPRDKEASALMTSEA
ncbi:glutathione hydrolase 7-like [Chanos chanos]|uniref:Glutathione hydrolase n=1 Tax=Chanos chanos TaxID=29144 RepID=A0A6J2VMH5_CHACN|nr:glutathione hydrolase 7-like [Chanos chanos]